VDFFSVDSDDIMSSEEGIEYDGGCYKDEDPGFYEAAISGKTYDFNYIPVEIRSSKDPYTVWAENEYNLGKDLTILFWVSIFFVVAAFIFMLVLLWAFYFLIKKKQR
jgi:hypothetical protein